ncbi:MAG: Fur family transcriptional regulator [Solimonas sp.]
MSLLEALCRRRGLRLTEHRRIVLEVLEAATDHPNVREIHRRVAAGHCIGLATVYRALNSPAAAGIVMRRTFPDGSAHYQRSDTASRSHLFDLGEGKLLEVDDVNLVRLADKVAEQLGYRLVDYRLSLFGRKQDCAKSETRELEAMLSRRRSSGTWH